MRNSAHLVSAAAGFGIIAVAAAVWTGSPASAKGSETTARRTGRVLDAYAKLPLTFVENRGQTNARVPVQSRYVLHDGRDGDGRYGFAVGAGYRSDHELIIDPGLEYSTFSATYAGTTRTATLTVTPAAPPPQTATLTVTATGRSGERVTSSPAGISVSTGSTGSASFASNTAITLSVSNGREPSGPAPVRAAATSRRPARSRSPVLPRSRQTCNDDDARANCTAVVCVRGRREKS